MRDILDKSIYTQPATVVAPALLGAILVRELDGVRISGVITETEAYQGQEDKACKASRGKTPGNLIMYDEAGIAFVYFTYGMHWMMNVVCDQLEEPAAVLIRAIEPLEGLAAMRSLREQGFGKKTWLNGPAKLSQALEINRAMNGISVCDKAGGLWIEKGIPVPPEVIKTSPRIGIQSTPEPWLSKHWRWYLDRADIEELMKRIKESDV